MIFHPASFNGMWVEVVDWMAPNYRNLHTDDDAVIGFTAENAGLKSHQRCIHRVSLFS